MDENSVAQKFVNIINELGSIGISGRAYNELVSLIMAYSVSLTDYDIMATEYDESIEIAFEDGSRMWLRYDYSNVRYECGVFK